MTNKIIILGGGGHGKVVIGLIQSIKAHQILGIIDSGLKVGHKVLGVTVLGNEEMLESYSQDQTCLTIGVGKVCGDELRQNIFNTQAKYTFPSLVHPSAICSVECTWGDGTQIMAGAILQPLVHLGKNVIINTGAIIEHDCVIASHVHVAPGAVIGGGTTIGENTMIGLGARVLPKITIGKNVTVGAGAMVVKNIPDGTTVKGVPAN